MIPLSLSDVRHPPQGPPWRRRRRCLLKGCERWFRPSNPLCRYCSAKCRQAAEDWQRWRSQQKYRASREGRNHRQEQARRYRQRCRARASPRAAPPAPASPSDAGTPSHSSVPCAAPPATVSPPADDSAATCEGKRLLEKSERIPLCPCKRPGCYVLFPAGSEYNPRRFCCALCRKVLRCVLEREARWRRRRRRGLRRRGRRPRPRARGP
jgi:hypothetical protein